jgi:hypothetical protein
MTDLAFPKKESAGQASCPAAMESSGFEPEIPPCHGGVIPFHYDPDPSDISINIDYYDARP